MASITLEKSKTSDLELTPIPSALKILTLITVFGLLGTLYLGLVNVGTDVEQGEVQRLFYIHMPAFFGAFTAFGATVFGGFMYLTRRDPKWDRLAVAGVEVGLALSTVNLLTGIAWMRPIWNSWWL
ncbi:MAG: cytochrome c biogenesis protein CcsA, partial [Chloroflexota bacterium]